MTQTFIFIIVLRALSALIITNSHYNNIYPLEIIANGGLLGDVLFFAISGFAFPSPDKNSFSGIDEGLFVFIALCG